MSPPLSRSETPTRQSPAKLIHHKQRAQKKRVTNLSEIVIVLVLVPVPVPVPFPVIESVS